MAQNATLSIIIGATVAGGFFGTLTDTKRLIQSIGNVSDEINKKQKNLLSEIQSGFKRADGSAAALIQRYKQLKTSLTDIGAKKVRLGEIGVLEQNNREHRSQLRSQIMGTAGFGLPFLASGKIAAGFEDKVKDIAITANATREAEVELGSAIREVAKRYNQQADVVAEGVGVLVANGASLKEAQNQAGLLSEFATATRTNMTDAARMNQAFSDLGINANAYGGGEKGRQLAEQNMRLAFNQATSAGKMGSFETRDMAKWFPTLGGMMKSLGVTGNDAVVSLASRLQISRATAGNNDEAANNFKNFLAKLTSSDTVNDFKKKAGVDLIAKMQADARKGLDPISSGVGAVMAHMQKSAPQAAEQLKKLSVELASIKDPAERAQLMEKRKTMIESLGQRAGMGDLFQDQQAVMYLLAELQNQEKLKDIQSKVSTGKTEQGQDVIKTDFNRRMEGASEKGKAMMIAFKDLGIVVGNAVLPFFTTLASTITPLVAGFANFLAIHPTFAKGLLTIVAGLGAFRMGMLLARYGLSLLTSGLLNVEKLKIGWDLFKLMRLGEISKMSALLRYFGMSAAGADKLAGSLGKVGGAVKRFAGTKLGKGLGVAAGAYGLYDLTKRDLNAGEKNQGFMTKARSYGQGALSGAMIGMAFGPIGAAIGAALGLAYTFVVRNWDKIRNTTVQKVTAIGQLITKGWASIKATTIAKIGELKTGIINRFTAVTVWFGALPSKFAQFGKDMINGLINGIGSMTDSVLAKIAALGESIKNKFKSVLGIASPSKVFKGFGGWMMEGLGIGIDGQTQSVVGKIGQLARNLGGAFVPNLRLPTAPTQAIRAAIDKAKSGILGTGNTGVVSAKNGGVHITFSPQITIQGGAGQNIEQQAQKGLQWSLRELESMINRIAEDKLRKAF